MITKNNLLTEYPRISQSLLPKALQQEEFDFVAENIDLYDDDNDLRNFVDTFIKKLNEALKKNEAVEEIHDMFKYGVKKTPAAQKTTKKAKTTKVAKPRIEKKKPVKPKTEPKPRKVKPKTGTEVTEFPLEVQFIKSYCGWDGKVKTKTQVYTFIKRLQKAIAEKRIRKTSKHAKDIEYI